MHDGGARHQDNADAGLSGRHDGAEVFLL